jgi:16S rRNA (uracil1498-N3)-methyltransferase
MGHSCLTRLYVPQQLATGTEVTLPDDARHFLAHVLRAGVGDGVALFNAADGEFAGEITALDKKRLQIHLKTQTRIPAPEPDLWLCFAPVKKAPVDYLAQKAAELGVSCLIPTLTSRTIASRVNTGRLRANAIAGAEQTGRLSVPDVREPVRLMELLRQWPVGRRLLLADESHASPPLLNALQAIAGQAAANSGGVEPAAWAVLIGPEGGFTPEELRLIKSLPQTVSISLGPRLLRADTAALAALTGWQMVLGDWNSRKQPMGDFESVSAR